MEKFFHLASDLLLNTLHHWLNFSHGQLIWVCTLLGITIVLFISNKVRMDVIALLVITAFVLSGTLNTQEALAGFSDPNVILIALLFIIGDGLVRTGIAFKIGDLLLKVAGQSELRIILLLMLSVGLIGSVMSSTGIVAIFIPVTMSIAARTHIYVGRLMMPLSMAALISGMMTLVATPPNLVVNSELSRMKLDGFGFFSVTPIGISVLILGIIYMSFARHWLVKPQHLANHKEHSTRRTLRDLIRDYKLAGRARRLAVRAGSPFIGKSIENLKLRSLYGANIIGIERWRRYRKVMITVSGTTEIRANDILLIDMTDPETDVRTFCADNLLEPKILRGEYFSDQEKEVGMAEVAILPDSSLLGQTLIQTRFRHQYHLSVIGIRRGQEALTCFAEEPLRLGDTLLVCGDWGSIVDLQSKSKEFVVLNLPAEIDNVAPASTQALPALLSLIVMIFLMVTSLVPNVIAALIACLMMGAFRCITPQSAYQSIQWPSLILIVGMMPFALALQKTGGIDLIVNLLKNELKALSPHLILACIFMLCATIGLFISNTATAILTAPIAITIAQQLDYSVYPFAMTVAIATSAAFITPVSSPVNTMVIGPGGYTFGDFVKIGLPFTILVLVLSVFLIPLIFPFH